PKRADNWPAMEGSQAPASASLRRPRRAPAACHGDQDSTDRSAITHPKHIGLAWRHSREEDAPSWACRTGSYWNMCDQPPYSTGALAGSPDARLDQIG